MSDVQSPLRIAIVGGGASGAIMAVNLIRKAGGRPVEITIIDRTGDLGPGIPYRTANPDHRLNVAAARMSAVHEDPDHFLNWLTAKDPDAHGFDFAGRGTYGEYLRDFLASAEADVPENVVLRKVQAEVVSITIDSGRARIQMMPGPEHSPDLESEYFDSVVLCVGPLPGGDPIEVPEALRRNGTYISNAWSETDVAPAANDKAVLIIGAGLTMVDAAIWLAGSPEGPVVRAISRNGLVPMAHRRGFTNGEGFDLPPDGPISFSDALEIFLAQKRKLEAAGGDWRDAMDSMRPGTPEMWGRMPLEDRTWFLANFQRIWEVHRFRIAPEIAERFHGLVGEGRIEVSAGRVAGIEPVNAGARVTLATGKGAETMEVGHIINSTGASGNIFRSAPPVVSAMIEEGCVRRDDMLLGLDVTPDGQAIDREGNPSDYISLIGSIRRGVEWEAIGITEIRRHAAEIARRLLGPDGPP